MKHISSFLVLVFMVCSFTIKAQNMAAYLDYKNYFFTFDDGARAELEYLPVKSFQVGGNAVAYVDNKDNFKVFHKGETITLSENTISKYAASNYLVAYSTFSVLNVFDNGKVTLLSKYAESYSTGDSMVTFMDGRAYAFKAYYNGSVTTLEDGNAIPVTSFALGDNIVAYVNYLNQFKVFYRGQSINLTSLNRSLPYKAGKNIVAYGNDNYGFSIFHKWLKYDLEKLQPKSFDVGDDLAAFVNTNEELKVFYDGKLKALTTFEPPFYKVVDSLVVYNEAQKFKVFYKGLVYTLENYIPTDYQIDFNTIAYLDLQGRLKTFHCGKTTMVTNSAIDHFDLYRNVISYRVINQNYIYYNSKTYAQ